MERRSTAALVAAGLLLATAAPPARGAPTARPALAPRLAPVALPVVWTAPAGTDVPCDNEPVAMDFDGEADGTSGDSAFWMMWFAMRSFHFDDPGTAAELAAVGFDRYTPIHRPGTGVAAFVASRDDVLIVAFRGSVDPVDWISDVEFAERPGADVGVDGRVHKGFADAIADAWPALERALAEHGAASKAVWMTGHSRGGSLATLAAARLAGAYPERPAPRLVTIAAPRVGDSAFERGSGARLRGRRARWIHDHDLVPHLPPTARSRDAFGALLPVAQQALADLALELDYAHGGALTVLADDGRAVRIGEDEDPEAEDVAYWGALAEDVARGGLPALIDANRQQSERHNELSYLCTLRRLHAGY